MTCELCGNDLTGLRKTVRSASDHYNPERRLNVIDCTACGMSYLESKFQIDEESLGYASDPGFTEHWGRPAHMHDFELKRLFCSYRATHITVLAPKELRFLEFGSGTGFCISRAKEFGFGEIVGMDKDENACHQIRTREGVPMYASFDAIRKHYGDGYFDVIYSAHTLEHVLHLREALGHLHALLRQGGLFLAIVPNYSLLSVYFEKVFLSVIGPGFSYSVIQSGHLNYFTRKTLAAYLENAGFRGVRSVPSVFGEEQLRKIGLSGKAWSEILFQSEALLLRPLDWLGQSLLLTVCATKEREISANK